MLITGCLLMLAIELQIGLVVAAKLVNPASAQRATAVEHDAIGAVTGLDKELWSAAPMPKGLCGACSRVRERNVRDGNLWVVF